MQRADAVHAPLHDRNCKGHSNCMPTGTSGTISMLRGAMGTPPIPEDEQLVDIDTMGSVHTSSGQRAAQQTRFSAVLDTSVSEYPSPSTSPASSISHSLVSAATLADMQTSSHRHFHQTLLQFPRSATPPKPSTSLEVTTPQARIFLCAVINEAVQTERLPAREAMVAMSGVLGDDTAVTDRMYTFVSAGKNLDEQLRMLQLWIEFQSSPLAGAVTCSKKGGDNNSSSISPGDTSTIASPNLQESPYGGYYGPYGAYPPPPYPGNQPGVPPHHPHPYGFAPYPPPMPSRGSPPLQNGQAHQHYGGGYYYPHCYSPPPHAPYSPPPALNLQQAIMSMAASPPAQGSTEGTNGGGRHQLQSPDANPAGPGGHSTGSMKTPSIYSNASAMTGNSMALSNGNLAAGNYRLNHGGENGNEAPPVLFQPMARRPDDFQPLVLEPIRGSSPSPTFFNASPPLPSPTSSIQSAAPSPTPTVIHNPTATRPNQLGLASGMPTTEKSGLTTTEPNDTGTETTETELAADDETTPIST
ncbi:hypothetical protein FOL47_002273 [Perkinsus chesapeaki]|uniref:Uncharacterized protein n=1 Tax=Perkinsus chesapeaki TaxID=330153 RepID=A0A7J6MEM5_PERCH|nr:hypothetical protein FOL47_002273 [Perkinsus chesapeaki]